MKQPAKPRTSGSPVPMLASDIAATLKVEWRSGYAEPGTVTALVDGFRLDAGEDAFLVTGPSGVIANDHPDDGDTKRAAVLALAQHLHSQLVAAEGVMGSAAGAEAATNDPTWLEAFRKAKIEQKEVNALTSRMLEEAVAGLAPAAPPASGWHSICGGCGAKDPHPCRPGCLYGEPVAPPPALEEPKWTPWKCDRTGVLDPNNEGKWLMVVDVLAVGYRWSAGITPCGEAWCRTGTSDYVDEAKAAALSAWRALQGVKA